MDTQATDPSILDRIKGAVGVQPEVPAPDATPAAEVEPPYKPVWDTDVCQNCQAKLNTDQVCDACGYDKKLMIDSRG